MESLDGVGQREVSLGEVGAAVSREWKIAVYIFLATLILSGLAGWYWPKSYEATSKVAVYPLSLDATGVRTAELNIATEQVIVTSRQVASSAAEKVGGNTSIQDLQDRTSVTIPQNSNALEISVTANTAEGAAGAANAFAEAYLDYRSQAAAQLADSLSKGIDAQIATLLQSLDSDSSVAVREAINQQITDLRSQKSALTGTAVTPGDLVSRAVAPQSPSSPGLPLFLAGGIAMGALLGFAGALLRDRLNPTVHSAARLTRHVNCRVLDGRNHHPANLPRQVAFVLDAFRQHLGLPEAQAPSVLVSTEHTDPARVLPSNAVPPKPVRVMAERGPAGVAEAVGALPPDTVFAIACSPDDRWSEVTAMIEAMNEWGREPSLVVIAPAAGAVETATAAQAPTEPIVADAPVEPPIPVVARAAAPVVPAKPVRRARTPRAKAGVEVGVDVEAERGAAR